MNTKTKTGKPILDALINASESMTDEEHEQLEARRKHGAKGTAYLPPDKSAHTPGPWHFENNGYAGLNVYDEFNDILVCCVREKSYRSATNYANAHLIAAAPDLLQICKMITRVTPDSEPVVMFAIVEKALAAIDKACPSA